jgi:hypothetical protein
MRKPIIIATSFAALTLTSGSAFAEIAIPDETEVKQWAFVQEGPAFTFERDFIRGDILPGTIPLTPVPNFPHYGFVIVNNERVIADAATRKVLAVY